MTRLLTLILCALTISVQAANLYVRPGISTGNNSGTSWDNAFKSTQTINWSTVQPGDTIWAAGGFHFTFVWGKDGTSGSRIAFKRATAANPECTGAAGWNSSFDSQVVIGVPYGAGFSGIRLVPNDFITIDGQVADGIKFTLPTPTVDVTTTQAAHVNGIYAIGASNIFKNITFIGPDSPSSDYGIFYGDNGGGFGKRTNVWIAGCKFSGLTASCQPSDTDGILVENCDFGHTPGNALHHDNSLYLAGLSNGFVVRNNYFHDGCSVSFTINAQGPPGPNHGKVYGNVWWGTHQALQYDASGPTPWQLGGDFQNYNNTFVNCTVNALRADSRWPGLFSSAVTGGAFTNNLMWNVTAWGPAAMAHDYNFINSGGTLFGETHGIQNTPFSPFVNLGTGDLHIVGNLGPTFPRANGIATLPEVSPDKDGVIRNNPPSIGAYEFPGMVVNPGTVSFSQATSAISETGASLIVTVNRSGGSSGAVSITATTADGTALSGHDYVSTSFALNWADGMIGARSFSIPIINSGDTASTNRVFTITLGSAGGGVAIGSPSTQTASIVMTRPAGTIQWSQQNYSTMESAASVALTATRVGGSAGILSGTYATANGTALSGHDYTATSGTITFADSDTASKTVTVNLINSGDTSASSRAFTVGLAGTGIGSPATANVTIAMNPVFPAGNIQWTASSFSTTEGASGVVLTAQRFGGVSGAISADYATADGSALSGRDYVQKVGTITWLTGDSANKSITVFQDNSGDMSNTPRTFTVTLSNPTGGAGLGLATTTVSIAMNPIVPPPPVVALGSVGFTPTIYSTTETSGIVTLSVTRTSGTNAAVQVQFATANATAAAGLDYVTKNGTLSWGANENSTKTFDVQILNSGSFGPPRSFMAILGAPSQGLTISPSQAAVSISLSIPIGLQSSVTIGGHVQSISGNVTIGSK